MEHLISFVVDEAPIFQTQAWLLLHNLEQLQPMARTRVLMVHCGVLRPELRSKAEQCGALICKVPRFGDGPAAYCNKLQQFDPVLAAGARHVTMLDTDMALLIDPGTLIVNDTVRAKLVDHCNPLRAEFQVVLERAGLGGISLDHVPEFAPKHSHNTTHPRNCNGGLYSLPTGILAQLAPLWCKWARFCLDQEPVLGRATLHSDQMGFAMAMQELAAPFDALPAEANFPIHFPENAYVNHRNCNPKILHYHRQLSADGRIVSPDVPAISAAVDEFNAMMLGARETMDFKHLLSFSHPRILA